MDKVGFIDTSWLYRHFVLQNSLLSISILWCMRWYFTSWENIRTSLFHSIPKNLRKMKRRTGMETTECTKQRFGVVAGLYFTLLFQKSWSIYNNCKKCQKYFGFYRKYTTDWMIYGNYFFHLFTSFSHFISQHSFSLWIRRDGF